MNKLHKQSIKVFVTLLSLFIILSSSECGIMLKEALSGDISKIKISEKDIDKPEKGVENLADLPQTGNSPMIFPYDLNKYKPKTPKTDFDKLAEDVKKETDKTKRLKIVVDQAFDDLKKEYTNREKEIKGFRNYLLINSNTDTDFSTSLTTIVNNINNHNQQTEIEGLLDSTKNGFLINNIQNFNFINDTNIDDNNINEKNIKELHKKIIELFKKTNMHLQMGSFNNRDIFEVLQKEIYEKYPTKSTTPVDILT